METFESAYQAAARAIMRKVDEKALEADVNAAGKKPPKARVKQVAAAAKALKALSPAQIAELKRDPGDLVLTRKGSAAAELQRDPGDLILGKGKKKGRGKIQATAPAGEGSKPAFGSPAWRAKYMKG